MMAFDITFIARKLIQMEKYNGYDLSTFGGMCVALEAHSYSAAINMTSGQGNKLSKEIKRLRKSSDTKRDCELCLSGGCDNC